MKIKKSELIICPECGAQYLPSEIYIPKAFFGNHTDLIKNQCGEILEYSGTNLDLNETYCCDVCNSTFKVSAKISFSTLSCKQKSIDEEYVSPLKQDTILLSETD